MSKITLESLDKNRLETFKKLKGFSNFGVLGGGTALSLQIAHRKSYDFDIFVKDRPDKNLWQKAKLILGNKIQKTLDVEDQLDLLTPTNVKITFFYDDYKQIFKAVKNPIINLMNIKDIALNKAYILNKRPKWRDYVDLYFVLEKNYLTLDKLITLSNKKFGNDFSEKLFLEQLVYWKDINEYGIEFIKKEVPPNEIKKFLANKVKIFKKKHLGF